MSTREYLLRYTAKWNATIRILRPARIWTATAQFLIFSVYIQPAGIHQTAEEVSIQPMLDEIESTIQRIKQASTKPVTVIMARDFNRHHPAWSHVVAGVNRNEGRPSFPAISESAPSYQFQRIFEPWRHTPWRCPPDARQPSAGTVSQTTGRGTNRYTSNLQTRAWLLSLTDSIWN
jgi:hypothetical protein